ncbi:hypothetical protein [Larkinella sp.]|uniref:hypothetical protein n=1 Tax=Larkinella sp. TaxID=2034517 RepID=UPI003BA87C55
MQGPKRGAYFQTDSAGSESHDGLLIDQDVGGNFSHQLRHVSNQYSLGVPYA